jgi:hypothetical protein
MRFALAGVLIRFPGAFALWRVLGNLLCGHDRNHPVTLAGVTWSQCCSTTAFIERHIGMSKIALILMAE